MIRERVQPGVLKSVFASFYAGLRLGVAVQPPYYHFGIGFRIGELCFGLFIIDSGGE